MEVTYSSVGLISSLNVTVCNFCGAMVYKVKQDEHTHYHKFPDGEEPESPDDEG